MMCMMCMDDQVEVSTWVDPVSRWEPHLDKVVHHCSVDIFPTNVAPVTRQDVNLATPNLYHCYLHLTRPHVAEESLVLGRCSRNARLLVGVSGSHGKCLRDQHNVQPSTSSSVLQKSTLGQCQAARNRQNHGLRGFHARHVPFEAPHEVLVGFFQSHNLLAISHYLVRYAKVSQREARRQAGVSYLGTGSFQRPCQH
jgi:hypothetical protein